MHSDCETLIRYCDDELPPRARRAVDAHLTKCEECRLECHRLRSSMSAAKSGAPDASGLLDAILHRVSQWEDSRQKSGASGTAVKGRIGARLEPLLGAAATRRLLDPVPESGEGILGGIEPVIALFLGSRTALRFMDKIGNETIVRL